MSPLTQLLLALLVVEAFTWEGIDRRRARWVAVMATLLPDLDWVLWLTVSEHASVYWHQTTTHSVFALFVFPGLVALVIGRVLRSPIRPLWRLAQLVVALHLVVDLCGSGGIAWLAPLDFERVSLGLFLSGDLVLPVVALVALILCRLRATKGRRIARGGLMTMVVWTLCAGLGQWVVGTQALSLAEQHDVAVDEVTTWPVSPVWPLHRIAVLRSADSVYLSWPATTDTLSLRPNNLSAPAVQVALKTRRAKTFMLVAAEPRARLGDASPDGSRQVVELIDDRTRGLGLFAWPAYSLVFELERTPRREFRVVRSAWRALGQGEALLGLDEAP